MRCEECRDAISAQLDGEDLPGEADAVDAHVAGCAACRAYAESASRVTRLVRTRVAEDEPDLVAAVLADVPAGYGRLDRTQWVAGGVRVALATLGIAQAGLALSGLISAGAHGHTGVELAGASTTHFAHESSAWNLALGVAFLLAATGFSRMAGIVPVLAAFLGLLAVLSVPDLIAGRVDGGRLLGHGIAVAGLVLLVVLKRVARDGGGGAGRGTPDADVDDLPARPLLRGLPSPADRGDDGLAPTAHAAGSAAQAAGSTLHAAGSTAHVAGSAARVVATGCAPDCACRVSDASAPAGCAPGCTCRFAGVPASSGGAATCTCRRVA